jgi:cytochrome c oxidase subunit 2
MMGTRSGHLWLLMLVACSGGQLSMRSQLGAAADAAAREGPVIRLRASRWQYEPNTIELQRGVPVTLEITSSDVHHGFNVPGLGIRADVLPDGVTRVQLTAAKAGTFAFRCDYYCGSGHEGMDGTIEVR